MPFPVQRHLFGPFLTAHFQWDIILFRSLSLSPILYIGINRFDINETINEIHCSLKSIFRMMRIMRQTVVIRSSACILIMLPLEWIINKCHYFMMQWLLSIHINYTEESLWALVRSSLAGWWCTHTHTHRHTMPLNETLLKSDSSHFQADSIPFARRKFNGNKNEFDENYTPFNSTTFPMQMNEEKPGPTLYFTFNRSKSKILFLFRIRRRRRHPDERVQKTAIVFDCINPKHFMERSV